MVAVQARLEIARELVDPDISLFLLQAMTADAVFLQKRFQRFGPADGAHRAQASSEQQRGEEGEFHVHVHGSWFMVLGFGFSAPRWPTKNLEPTGINVLGQWLGWESGLHSCPRADRADRQPATPAIHCAKQNDGVDVKERNVHDLDSS